MSEFNDVVMSRKSVRTYDGRKLTPEDMASIKDFAAAITNPWDIKVDWVFMDAEEFDLSSPVLAGEKQYVAGLVDKVPYADVAFGYSFEKFVLYAWSLGIGTVWIGGTMKRAHFEESAGLTEGRRMPCISPLGYPAARRSIKETMMRKGVKADVRKPLGELFFDGNLDTPLEETGSIRRAMEMVRWAPSAVNKQPWRIIRKDGSYHFYEKKDKGYVSDEVGDMQKIDIGISIYHFVAGLKEEGLDPAVITEDPAIAVDAEMEYIATVKI